VAVTDTDGRFSFAPDVTRPYVVTATAPGRAGATVGVDLRDPSQGEVAVALPTCAIRVHGRVTDAGGPIPGARVRRLAHNVFVGLTGPRVTADATGAYELCATPGLTALRVDADGYGSVEWSGTLYEDLREDVKLVPESTIIGTAVDEDTGAPVAGAQINLRGWDSAALQPATHSVVTDEAGHFEVDGLAPGRYSVGAWGADYLNERDVQEVAVTVGALPPPVTLRLTRCVRLGGTVSEGGRAVVCATVRAMATGDKRGYSFEAITQADGSFQLKGAPPGLDRFSVEGYHVTSAPGDNHVTVERLPAITGTVHFGDAPADGAWVNATPLASSVTSSPKEVRVDRTGLFRIDGLEPGRYEVRASDDVRAAASATVQVDAGGSVDLELTARASIGGVVVDQDGHPVSGADVTWSSSAKDPKLPGRFSWSGFAKATGRTNEEGRFVVRGLAAGTYKTTVAVDGVTLDPALRVDLAAGQQAGDVRVEVRIERATVTGRVIDASGQGVPDTLVTLAGSGDGVRADTDGAFVLPVVGDGPFTVEAGRGDGGRAQSDGVRPGAAVTLTLIRPAVSPPRPSVMSLSIARATRGALSGRAFRSTSVPGEIPPRTWSSVRIEPRARERAGLLLAPGSPSRVIPQGSTVSLTLAERGFVLPSASVAGLSPESVKRPTDPHRAGRLR
jgi:protocatechuate 3,4-dioxygenase beta subunit